MKSRILVIVIQVPNSNRSNPLINALILSENFEVNIFSAIMYRREMSEYKPNFEKHKLLYGRELSNGEVGCTISHWSVYQRYKSNYGTVVVLEDDARIPNMEEFEQVVFDFQNRYGKDNAVLSLLPWKGEKRRPHESRKLRRLIGHSPLTVGYVITRPAMKELLFSNSDFSYLPDWPPSATKFYITFGGVIDHGDSATFSVIDRNGRIKTRRYLGILHFLLITYLRSPRTFRSFGEYWQSAIFPSFSWRIDKFTMFVRRYFL